MASGFTKSLTTPLAMEDFSEMDSRHYRLQKVSPSLDHHHYLHLQGHQNNLQKFQLHPPSRSFAISHSAGQFYSTPSPSRQAISTRKASNLNPITQVAPPIRTAGFATATCLPLSSHGVRRFATQAKRTANRGFVAVRYIGVDCDSCGLDQCTCNEAIRSWISVMQVPTCCKW
jgi:hypothetical protein